MGGSADAIHCESAAGTATADEGKCEDGTAKSVAKLIAAIENCAAKCVKAVDKGDSRDCDPAGASTRRRCVPAEALDSAAKAIDKACEKDKSDCWSGGRDSAPSGGRYGNRRDGRYNEYFLRGHGAHRPPRRPVCMMEFDPCQSGGDVPVLATRSGQYAPAVSETY